jgi:DNA primase
VRVLGSASPLALASQLDDKRKAVDPDHDDRLVPAGSGIAAGCPDLSAELYLTIRATGREDGAGPAHHGADAHLHALAAHPTIPEQHLAEEDQHADRKSDDVPRRRHQDEKHDRDDQEHASKAKRSKLLATTKVEDFNRFLDVFSRGAEKRRQHGSKGSTVSRDPSDENRVWAILDWAGAG